MAALAISISIELDPSSNNPAMGPDAIYLVEEMYYLTRIKDPIASAVAALEEAIEKVLAAQ